MGTQSDLPAKNYALIKTIFLLTDDGDRRLLQTFGLSVARFSALTCLAEDKPLTATDLCQRLLCNKANITRLVDGLEKEGLIARTPDEADGRRTYLTLTAVGKKRWSEANLMYQSSIEARFGCLSTEEEHMLHTLLSQLSSALQDHLRTA